MKFKHLLSICILSISATVFSQNLSVFDVSFSESMGHFYNDEQPNRSLESLKRAYEKNHFLKVMKSKPKNYQSIPKIIHQIWIGPKKLPEKCIPLMQTWVKHHPDWEYKLWTNKDLEEFDTYSQKAIKSAVNIGSKVDIFKYEILYKYGGVYIDADFECIKPLDLIVENSQFFAGIYAYTWIGNGIIGSVKEHPVLENLLKYFKKKQLSSFKDPLRQTGPKFFTHVIKGFLSYKKELPLLIFPVSFFHPYPRCDRQMFWKENQTTESLRKVYSKPETFAIHYWAGSWI